MLCSSLDVFTLRGLSKNGVAIAGKSQIRLKFPMEKRSRMLPLSSRS
ncbi:MAG: hypothetical protein F6K47_43160 [Symploca sp. SIO2E6]|nr:hypothetical protein [Symploca sp. SIO2E6]